ncbi:MAG TPA: serine/threonine protein kinase [Mycobacterium sp.]|nr:serine/threonine protein kinase [Mycobacterium sp.]
MASLAKLPYYEVVFNADGTLNTTDHQEHPGLQAAVAAGGITDVFVFSHGWNNGVDSARTLYAGMFSLLQDQLGSHLNSSAFVGVLWPSLLFPDDDPTTPKEVVPSSGRQLVAAIAPAMPEQQSQLDTIGQLLDDKPQDEDKLAEFHSLTVGLVTTPPQADEDAGESTLLTAEPSTALGHAATMAPKASSDAQGVGNMFGRLWAGGRELLRTMSYYEMKNRAGVVGRQGLGPLLGALSGPAGPPRIHLIGHSFGARLVSYALSGLPAGAVGSASPVKSLSLVQGAFSHFAFASSLPFDRGRSGALAGFVDRVDGPLVATFTGADRAVGKWYPAASLLARQDAEGNEAVTFRWGAMGHDGYQNDPAAQTVTLATGTPSYGFAAGKFYALDASSVIARDESPISGAHSDIQHAEVTWAIRQAARLRG